MPIKEHNLLVEMSAKKKYKRYPVKNKQESDDKIIKEVFAKVISDLVSANIIRLVDIHEIMLSDSYSETISNININGINKPLKRNLPAISSAITASNRKYFRLSEYVSLSIEVLKFLKTKRKDVDLHIGSVSASLTFFNNNTNDAYMSELQTEI